MALASAIGFFMIAVQIVPFLVALAASDIVRTRDASAVHHVRLFSIAAQILPGFLGSPLRGEIDLSGIAQPREENFNERSSGYAGAITLLLLLVSWRRLSRELRVGLLIGLAALVISWRLPLIDAVFRTIPPFSVAANERFGLVFILFSCMAIPAALSGVAASAPRRRIGIATAVLAGLIALAALVAVIPGGRKLLLTAARQGVAVMQERQFLRKPNAYYEERLHGYLEGVKKVAVRRVAAPAALIAAAGAALAMRRRTHVAAVVGALVVAETLIFAWGYSPAVAVDQALPPAVQQLRALDPQNSFLIAAGIGIYDANLGTIDGLRDVRSYDVLQSHERIGRLVALGFDRNSRAFGDHLRADQIAGLAHDGVRFLLARQPSAGLRLVGGLPSPAVGVYELPGSRPAPWPANTAPSGLMAGLTVTVLALVSAMALLRFLPYHKF